MPTWRDFDPLEKLPSTWTDAIEQMLSTDATLNFKLEKASSTTVRVVAGTNNDQVGLWIVGSDGHTHPRWITATKSATHPGGSSGTYDILATCAVDQFAAGEVDNTDHNFYLKIVAAGGTGSGTGTEAYYRKIGTCTWDGSQITAVTPLIGIAAGGYVRYFERTFQFGGGQVQLSGAPTDDRYVIPYRVPILSPKQSIRCLGAVGEVQGTAGATATGRLWRKAWGGGEAVPSSWTGLVVTTSEQDFTTSLTPFSLAHRDRLRWEWTATTPSPVAYNPYVSLFFEETVLT